MSSINRFKKRVNDLREVGQPQVRVVTDRVFLLGLDELYREATKRHERGHLLECARCVANALSVSPARGPVEGYYSEDKQLSEYFRLVRALQEVEEPGVSGFSAERELTRLRDVMSAPLYGRAQRIRNGKRMLLPVGRNALSQALIDAGLDWTVERLTSAAHHVASETDDISLVGLASMIRDPVVLCALGESVVLYAEMGIGAALERSEPEYVWDVDANLSRQATRFVDTYNSLFGEELPLPDSSCAELFWKACRANEVVGRCVRLGTDGGTLNYHWAIYDTDGGGLAVHEFWSSKFWTTKRYRSAGAALRSNGPTREPGSQRPPN